MSTRNISRGLKVTRVLGWQPYHLHVPNVLKSESLNLLEPSGPVQACNGIALPDLCGTQVVKHCDRDSTALTATDGLG